MSMQAHGRNTPARLHVYLECPNCGWIPKPQMELLVVPGTHSLSHVHCHFKCDQCGSRKAVLHFEREMLSLY
jgi:predicted RNA-binding Zn-ribbon protein involved in translation (DUF1610 family)